MTAGAATAGARAARWLLLACTILGLAAMHTIGHAGMASHESHPATAGTSINGVAAAAPSLTSACSADHCPAMPGHGMAGGWSVCLAILTGLAAALLLAVALFAAATRVVTLGTASVPPLGSRAPPRRPPGLTLTATTVLRI